MIVNTVRSDDEDSCVDSKKDKEKGTPRQRPHDGDGPRSISSHNLQCDREGRSGLSIKVVLRSRTSTELCRLARASKRPIRIQETVFLQDTSSSPSRAQCRDIFNSSNHVAQGLGSPYDIESRPLRRGKRDVRLTRQVTASGWGPNSEAQASCPFANMMTVQSLREGDID